MRQDQPSVGARNLTALPGARSCNGLRPEGRKPFHFNYFSSAAFQYASLTNFDQLSIRTSCAAYSGFHIGRTGCLRSRIPACLGVRSAFALLHLLQASTQLSQVD